VARPQTVSDEQILDAALQCFLEHGPSVATEVIAHQLNVSPQALLKRFGTKHELMIAAVRPKSLASSIPLLHSGPDNRPLAEQLSELLNEVAVYFIAMARRMSVLKWSSIDPRELMSGYDEPPPLLDIRTLAEWLDRAAAMGLIRQVDFRAVATMLLSALHGPAMLTDMLGDHPTGHTTDEYVSILVDTLLSGLACQSSDESPLNEQRRILETSVDHMI
jgi:AcrR family transcriptional regulator